MKRIAKFEKVSIEQWRQGYSRVDAERVYESIALPKRATSGSAGYDFFAPFSFKNPIAASAVPPVASIGSVKNTVLSSMSEGNLQ